MIHHSQSQQAPIATPTVQPTQSLQTFQLPVNNNVSLSAANIHGLLSKTVTPAEQITTPSNAFLQQLQQNGQQTVVLTPQGKTFLTEYTLFKFYICSIWYIVVKIFYYCVTM